ncbi:carboxypeptidase N subunit 2 [Hippoglossus hippoglossus]|uniref:carboxypeptidase N subunit 2 n=1 Tax=Hippoglossus hippoglossus TaxID=8267 RepID=UPI00148CCDFC|nr:carboxypeptidase N subunit 2 [Hippoglossus hippoglossus]XP_034470377.1 carboxypeptidase N subunit 2 [Hippoglossus hippoglossus]
MDKHLSLTLLLMLLLCPKSNTESQTSCPYRCQCFTPLQVLCAEERMTSLPKNMCRQVKELIVMTSAVAYLLPHTLEESPQLTELVFLNNALRSIHAQAFENLTQLQELEISGNPWLENLFMGTFSQQRNLTKLLLNFNRFKTVLPGMFDSLKQMETLQMKGNIISHLPMFLFLNLHNLRVLDLSQNKLEEVKRETFFGLTSLEILKVNNNLISNLTCDTFHTISQLTELHLEGNKISELTDGIFSVLTQLNVLNLRGNLLTTFSQEVFGFNVSNLRELNLKGNRLTELSSLSRLTSLTDLVLSSNQLSSLPEDIFRNVTLLENLDLSENQLSLLPELIFYNLSGIISIHLHKNNLRRLEPKLFNDQWLTQQIYLSDNQLETLPPGLFDPFIVDYTVRLHGNPWRCDCHMWYLHDWVLRNNDIIQRQDSVLCNSPGFLRQHVVASVDKDQLVCRVSADEMPDLRSCSIQAFDDTMIVKCKVDKCSPMTVKVQFQEDDGSITEHVLKTEHSECSNGTRIEGPVH